MNVKENDQRVHLLNREKTPFVVLGRTDVGFAYNFVDRDFEAVDRIALNRLKDFGHKNIGVVLSDSPIPTHLKKAAASLKLKLHPIDVTNTTEGGVHLASVFSTQYANITGIISLLDAATLGFVNSASDFGLSIPNDVSIIGVNMLESQADSANPAISTVAFNAYEMAKSCGKIMVEVIEAGKENKKKRSELWVGEYVDRGSITRMSEA